MKQPLFLAASIVALALPSFATDYDEGTSGDLSDDHLMPTALTLTPGMNIITASQQGDALGRDVDYIATSLPGGMRITQVILENYISSPGDLAFMGLQAGPNFATDYNSTDPSTLLGGIIYSSAEVGTNIFPTMGTFGGAIGFTPPLLGPVFTWWFNQTEEPSTLVLKIVVEMPVGTSFCSSLTNSTGQAATISAFGSALIADNQFHLVATNVPVGTPGLFFFGPNQIQLPFGDGLRCVGGSIQRIQPPSFGGPNGIVEVTLDLSAPPAAGVITSFSTSNFQYWFRDVPGGPAGFNLSDGLTVFFL
jgi:hypothetical protein